jgi:hypothetical protein
MLDKLFIEGFQSLGLPQNIELAPLTFLFGPNSSGKSSVGRSLRFLAQSSNQSGQLVYSGPQVDLSSFRAAVHAQNSEDAISVGVSLTELPGVSTMGSARISSLGAKWIISDSRSWIPTTAHFDLVFQSETSSTGTSSAEAHLVFESNQYDEVVLSSAEFTGDDAVLASLAPSRMTEDSPGRGENESARYGFSRGPLVPRAEDRRGNIVLGGGRVIDIDRLLSQIRNGIGNFFGSLSYCGPVREISAQFVDKSRGFEAVRPDGSNIQTVLGSIPDSEFSLLSNWLESLTDGIYGLERVPVTAEIPHFDPQVQTFLRDKYSGALVAFKDAGAGISQLLPILVHIFGRSNVGRTNRRGSTSYSRGNLGSSAGLVLIEQPELHLHPKMQAMMADFLLENSVDLKGTNRKPQVICETHSEQMLLRVQRRISEGKYRPEDVAVFFVDRFPGSKSSYVQRLRIGENGNFLDSWPLSFSNLRLDEILDN